MRKYLVIFLMFLCVSVATAKADTRYVLVRSELNVRGKASLGSEIHGRLFAGDRVNVARTYKDWCFLEDLPSEEGCGWVSSTYLVAEPVTQYDGNPAIISANGRVAVRKTINGERTQWVHPGDTVSVYAMSETWSVTDRGYIKTEYLRLK